MKHDREILSLLQQASLEQVIYELDQIQALFESYIDLELQPSTELVLEQKTDPGREKSWQADLAIMKTLPSFILISLAGLAAF